VIRRAISQAATPIALKRQVRAVFSTADTDQMGDQVVQSGIDLTAYRNNPIILWSHSPATPIARCITVGLDGGNLAGLVQFPPAGTSALSDEIYGLITNGIVSACSIGFQPTETQPLNPQKPYAGQKFTKSVLYEISFVSVPANSAALVTERSNAGVGTQRAAVRQQFQRTAAARAREVEAIRLAEPPLSPIERRQAEWARLAARSA
jgi:HK97 family phage prohead protease